jgi:hypothetical protein
MAQLKLSKLNIIDLATVMAVVLMLGILGLYSLNRPKAETTRLNVTIEISDASQVQVITEQAAKDKTIYLDSINIPISVSSVSKQGGKLEIHLQGSGHVDNNGYFIFDGQRILIGQKAEIHANYYAKGKIVAIEHAN